MTGRQLGLGRLWLQKHQTSRWKTWCLSCRGRTIYLLGYTVNSISLMSNHNTSSLVVLWTSLDSRGFIGIGCVTMEWRLKMVPVGNKQPTAASSPVSQSSNSEASYSATASLTFMAASLWLRVWSRESLMGWMGWMTVILSISCLTALLDCWPSSPSIQLEIDSPSCYMES